MYVQLGITSQTTIIYILDWFTELIPHVCSCSHFKTSSVEIESVRWSWIGGGGGPDVADNVELRKGGLPRHDA